ncbi:unnamed protein product [Peronospora destructor]|uniref:Lysophospholipid acyltransferase n=1 Tax=Peronospora destructor TaxID=86335 RepID=A0AAV0UGD8_9STRA|nr:unnamed protein product [Peronospora destructor]
MGSIIDIVERLQPYAELITPLDFSFFHGHVNKLSASLGLGSDQLRYVLCLFAAYPLAVVYKLLPSASLKHMMDVAVGLSMAQFVLGSGWVHSFISSFVTYLLVKFEPPKHAPSIVFLFNMLYMSASHIYRLYRSPYTDLCTPLSNLHDPKVAALPLLLQIWRLYITLFFCKAKYYSAWKIAEGATVLCGFGFEGFSKDGSSLGWNGVSNMDILGFEFSQSIRAASRAWNKGTQNWLERYVYTRTGNSLMATYFISAFWHGFYPGYYLFFMSRNPAATAKTVYDIMSYLVTLFSMHYFVMPFQAMSWENSLLSLKNTYFVGHIAAKSCFTSCSPPSRHRSQKKTQSERWKRKR